MRYSCHAHTRFIQPPKPITAGDLVRTRVCLRSVDIDGDDDDDDYWPLLLFGLLNKLANIFTFSQGALIIIIFSYFYCHVESATHRTATVNVTLGWH